MTVSYFLFRYFYYFVLIFDVTRGNLIIICCQNLIFIIDCNLDLLMPIPIILHDCPTHYYYNFSFMVFYIKR